jgi:hypothetical protein
MFRKACSCMLPVTTQILSEQFMWKELDLVLWWALKLSDITHIKCHETAAVLNCKMCVVVMITNLYVNPSLFNFVTYSHRIRYSDSLQKAFDSVRREVMYNILNDCGIPMKLVMLIKMCLNETKAESR